MLFLNPGYWRRAPPRFLMLKIYSESCWLYLCVILFKAMFSLSYATVIDPLLRDIRVYTPTFSGMKAGDRVLDVCCGTGDQVVHYAGRGIIATGIDLNPDMIEAANKNKSRQGIANVSFQTEDAQKLSFRDDFFDLASISLALHEKERIVRGRIISEMKRVVRRGGVLIFIDYSVPLPRNVYSYLIKAIEFVAGRDHFRCFRDYIKQGGLDELLKENHLQEERRGYLKKGTITVIKARNA